MKRIGFTLSMIAVTLGIWAQTLTINDCVTLAADHYPAIARYGLLEKAKEFNLSNASKSWLPQGAVTAQASWQNDVAALPELLTNMMAQQGAVYPGMSKYQYKIGVDVNQQIWDGGRTEAARRTIATATEAERRSIDVQLYDVGGRVEELYFALLLYDARIERTDKSIAMVDSTLGQVRALYANGVAMQTDCYQVEARLLTLRQQKAQLTAARGSYQRMMETFIGQPLSGRTLILPEKAAEAGYDHPQLKLFDARVDNLASQEAGIKASVMPQIGAFVSGYYGYPGFNMFRNMQKHDPSFNFMIGLRATWNFGSLYTHRNSLDKLKVQQQQIETERETFLFNNSIAENDRIGEIEYLRKVMEDDERIVGLHAAVVRAARSQLRNGVIDTTALLTKITDEELAENDLSLHRIELIKAIYQLNHIRNK